MEIAAVTDDCTKPGASLNGLISSPQLPHKADSVIPILQMGKLTPGALLPRFPEATQVKKVAQRLESKACLTPGRSLSLLSLFTAVKPCPEMLGSVHIQTLWRAGTGGRGGGSHNGRDQADRRGGGGGGWRTAEGWVEVSLQST